MEDTNNFVRALDRATKYESETLHPEQKINRIEYGNNVAVTTTVIHKVRPEKKYVKIGVKDIVHNGER